MTPIGYVHIGNGPPLVEIESGIGNSGLLSHRASDSVRADDVIKSAGHLIGPFEVESALMTHPAVVEAAVVGEADADDLIKPKAFILCADGTAGDEALATELQQHVKDMLAPYKYPRWIEFVDDLPKTATGKIQRFKLRS